MNIHKRIIVVLMVFASMQAAQIKIDVMSGIGSALSAEIEDETESLEEYKRRVCAFDMNIVNITGFLDTQIKHFGINPEQVGYYVGDKWLFKKIGADKYTLIMPSDMPSLLEMHKMMLGKQYSPEHVYNINALNTLLRKNNAYDDPLFHKYRLEIIKTLMKTKMVNMQALCSNVSISSTESIGMSLLKRFDPYLGYIMVGGRTLYNQIAGMQDDEMLQIDIDRYLLKRHDVDLIRTRIDELEALVNQQEESVIGRGQAWISRNVLQSGSSTYTKKRLDVLSAVNEF